MTDYLLQLHDDALISIGEYVGKLYGPDTYVRLGQTCKRMKRLLLPDDEDASAQTIQNIIRLRMSHYTAQRLMPRDFSINSLKELAVFETWCETPLHDDNRIPFQFASVNIHEGMRDKIFAIIGIMKRYGSVRVQLDSHCGIIAPNSVASSFSRSRGHSIKRVLDDPSRVEVIGWGKRIANKVARSNTHPFGELARQGRGWVEVYIVLGDGDDNSSIMLPPRHEYYNSDRSTTDDDVDEAVMDPEILHEFWQHHFIHSRR